MTIWNEPRLTVRRANSGVRPEQICPQVHVDLARLGRDEQSLHSWLGNDAGRSSPSDHHRDDRALPVSARSNHTAEVRERPIRVLLAPARRALGRGVSDCSPGRNSEAPRARAGARALHRHAPRRRGGKYEAPRLAQCANASVSAQRLGLLSWTKGQSRGLGRVAAAFAAEAKEGLPMGTPNSSLTSSGSKPPRCSEARLRAGARDARLEHGQGLDRCRRLASRCMSLPAAEKSPSAAAALTARRAPNPVRRPGSARARLGA